MDRRFGSPGVGVAAAFGLAIVLTVTGCGFVERLAPTPAPIAEEHMPSYASIWVTAEPAVAERPVSVGLRIPDEAGFSREETIAAGAIVRVSFGVSEGRYRLVGLDGACAIELVLGPERETDVVIRVDDDGSCALVIVREHGIELGHEEASGTLMARVTAEPGGDLRVQVRSLDEPMDAVPDPVAPDEGGLAIIPLWPGRYEVLLLRNSVAIETTEITIRDSRPAGDLVELILDGRPD